MLPLLLLLLAAFASAPFGGLLDTAALLSRSYAARLHCGHAVVLLGPLHWPKAVGPAAGMFATGAAVVPVLVMSAS